MSNHISFSFIGLHDYTSTTYAWGDETIETPFIQEATRRFFEPDQVLVAMTPDAREKQEALLRDRISFERLDIPEGKNEEEWWNIFKTIVEAVPAQSRLTIDITHGFRSQPVIALAIAVYLQAARDVTIERIVYGRFKKGAPTNPILDLTPFLDMIEWSVAARQFVRDGNADVLARKMDALQGNAHRSGAENPPVRIKPAGDQLKELTEALSVVRTEEVAVQRAGALVSTLAEARDEASITDISGVKPLGELLKQAEDRVRPLQSSNLYDDEGFAAQAEMMRFFLETNQLQQAITLAREALISHHAIAMDLDPKPAKQGDQDSGRSQATHALGALAREIRSAEGSLPEEEEKVAKLWAQMTDCRNDINHAGMNVDPTPSHRLAAQVHEVIDKTIAHINAS